MDYRTAPWSQFALWVEDIASLQHGGSPLFSLAGATSKDRWEDSPGTCPAQCLEQAPVSSRCQTTRWAVSLGSVYALSPGLTSTEQGPIPTPACARAQLSIAPSRVCQSPPQAPWASQSWSHLCNKIQHSSLATVVPSLPWYSVVIITVKVWRLGCIF